MADEFEALEADFQHHYGIVLRDALYGPDPIGGRRLWSLIKGLPPRSALHRSHDVEGWSWGNVEELLAGIFERLDAANYMYLKAHSKEGSQLPEPVAIPRPGRTTSPPARQPLSSTDDVKRFFKANTKASNA